MTPETTNGPRAALPPSRWSKLFFTSGLKYMLPPPGSIISALALSSQLKVASMRRQVFSYRHCCPVNWMCPKSIRNITGVMKSIAMCLLKVMRQRVRPLSYICCLLLCAWAFASCSLLPCFSLWPQVEPSLSNQKKLPSIYIYMNCQTVSKNPKQVTAASRRTIPKEPLGLLEMVLTIIWLKLGNFTLRRFLLISLWNTLEEPATQAMPTSFCYPSGLVEGFAATLL